ncbi:Protease Do-like 9 [Galdieria sulphuraria]|nr:Protease Do-like 9 [Galdieria sulphuraria]
MTENVRRKSRERKSGNTDLDEELLYHSSSPDQTSRISGGVNRRSKMDRSHSKLGNSNLCLQDEVEVEDYMHDDNVKDVEMSAGFPADVLDSVFKLYVTHCEPNYSLPWQKRRQTYSTSTAFAVGNRRILTNAHCVEHSTVVKIKKRGSEKKYMAQVVSIGNDCDIALLSVEDESFWEGGCYCGRIPHWWRKYICDRRSHAAINPGNSGGPAFNSRFECVGIAFQSLLTTEAENIGYIIPWLVVQHFLDDFDRNGYYTGFCYCGFEFQRMENEYLRKSFHLSDESGGVLIKRIAPTSPCSKVLQKGDVITHFDGVPIANDGTVSYRGESCTVRIVRNGNIMEVSYPLFELPLLVPIHEKRPVPEYLTVAGLVFVALSEPYLRSEYGEKWDFEAPVKLLDKLLYGYKRTANEQVVILSQSYCTLMALEWKIYVTLPI